MKKYLTIAIVYLTVAAYSTNAQEATVLRDTQGREIKAQIKRVTKGEVTINRSDGRLFTIPLSKFELRTQHMLRNWSERDILDRTVEATMRAAEVRAEALGDSDTRTLKFRNSAGKALLAANKIDQAIEYLKETAELWSNSRASDWGAYDAKHLLGYAMLLSKSGSEGEKLFVEGAEGMLGSPEALNKPKSAILLKSQASERLLQYFEATDPTLSKKWKQIHEGFQQQLQSTKSLPIDPGEIKTQATAHFTLVSPFSNTGDFSEIIEKIWEEIAAITPTMHSDFEKGNFRAPDSQLAPLEQYSEEGQFRFLLVLADQESLDPMVEAYLNTITEPKKRETMSSGLISSKFIKDPQNRFIVSQIKDPKSFKDPDNGWPLYRVIHNLPEALLKLTLRVNLEPSWLSMGLGYHFEHKLIGTASTHYTGGDLDEVGLKRSTDWHEPMRKLVNTGSIPNMKRINGGSARQGEDYGYIWAFVEMLLSNPEKQKLLGDFIIQYRHNRSFMGENEIALWFGYESPEAMGLALSDFIKSDSFQ